MCKLQQCNENYSKFFLKLVTNFIHNLRHQYDTGTDMGRFLDAFFGKIAESDF